MIIQSTTERWVYLFRLVIEKYCLNTLSVRKKMFIKSFKQHKKSIKVDIDTST